MKRREFIRLAGSAGLLAAFTDRFGIARRVLATAATPTLNVHGLPKFVTPLLVPPAMPRVAKLWQKGMQNVDYYDIAVRQFTQQILPTGYPATTVWGYGPVNPQGGVAVFNAPSLTIEAKYNRAVRIKWRNELVDSSGNFLPHLLPVDPTLHWANPGGGAGGRDSRPAIQGTATPGRYTGPVPLVTHVHGAAGVGDESDGYAEAWFLPDAGNIPAGYATEGTWYDFFRQKALDRFGEAWPAGAATFQYPNAHRASTNWYHDHTLGMTRLNVYAGPAGFFILRGGPGDLVLDARTGGRAVMPGPAPGVGDAPGTPYYEIPIAIQDRAFKADGSLFYPDTREFFDEVAGPYLPATDISPIWNPEFFGNAIMVNGSTWPYLTVEKRRYRFRFLNGCQARFLVLDFSTIPGAEVWLIGNESGFLPAPVNIATALGNRLLMSPAERFDVIVDFTNVPLGSYVLGNLGPDEPFGGGEPGNDFDLPDPVTTGQILQFRVIRAKGRDASTPPAFLQLPPAPAFPTPSVTRRVALLEQMSMYFDDAPAEALLGVVGDDPSQGQAVAVPTMWMEPVTETPEPGATELWEIYNTTGDAHPIHLHENAFEVVNRQAIVVDERPSMPGGGHEHMETTVQVVPGSTPRGPEPQEGGRKDTVIAYPGEVTRIRAQFNTPGQYVWHCHIVEHEDNEMMRPLRVGPEQPGQPGAAGRSTTGPRMTGGA